MLPNEKTLKSDVLKFLFVKSLVLPTPASGKSEQTTSQLEKNVPTVLKFCGFLQAALPSVGAGPKRKRNLGMPISALSPTITLALSFSYGA